MGSLLIAARGANWMINCKIPAANTPHAKVKSGVSVFGAIIRAKIINVKLKIKGVAAGNENFEWVFWIPPAKATREIKARYGNMIFNTVTESICLSGSK